MIGLKINKNSNCQEANTILLCSPATKKTTTNYKEESLLCILSWFIKMKRVYSWASLQYSGCWLQLFNCVMCEGLPHRIVGDGKITISQSQSQFLPAQKSLKILCNTFFDIKYQLISESTNVQIKYLWENFVTIFLDKKIDICALRYNIQIAALAIQL